MSRQAVSAQAETKCLVIPFVDRGLKKAPPLIRLQGICKSFGPLEVLTNVDLQVQAGEITALIGSSGCGKSTLLNILAGLDTQDHGTYTLAERRNPEKAGRQRVAYMFQEDRLLPWRTVQDNVALGLEAARVEKTERHCRVYDMLKLVGLEEFAGAFPYQLSGGMRSRAALARSLVVEPEVLLLDEPFSKLDSQTRSQMHAELLNIHAVTGMTAVFVTHDVEEAVVLADNVAVFAPRPGRITEIVPVELARPRSLLDKSVTEQIRSLRGKLSFNPYPAPSGG
ncbi:MAG: ABC transporter ATP-binding protein [Desulfovibrio sp.]|jgi:ABC-type nitrate/sulfonate/bicarbonate transport system ATPase subunit|nr:ABC transporter ATP-binding protein [Desulfovibrio sp.]